MDADEFIDLTVKCTSAAQSNVLRVPLLANYLLVWR